MKENPRVSIVVPIYNVENYLDECLSSICAQTMSDIEIICVNDGSKDKSGEIIQKYAKIDNRIRVISKENTGYGNTMNIGFSCARGDYIGIVESDDFVKPDMFEKLYCSAEKYACDVVYSNYFEYTNETGLCFRENLSGLPYDKIFNAEENPTVFQVNPAIWSGIYSRKFILDGGITFHETPGASFQDVSFGFSVMLKAKKIMCLKEAFLCYRTDNLNSSVKSPEKVFCIMDEFHRVEQIMDQMGKGALYPCIEPIKYRHYLGHYKRISPIFQYAYLMKMRDEFRADKGKGRVHRKAWPDELWNIIKQIDDDMEVYFKHTNIYYINQSLASKTRNKQIAHDAIIQYLKTAKMLIVYGAGAYAQQITKDLFVIKKVDVYAVTSYDGTKNINGIPVKEIDDLVQYKDYAVVLVAVKKDSQISIVNNLSQLGYKNVIVVDGMTLKDI